MPASLKDVKEKIESTKKTGQITNAMQMISTAKLSQIQHQADNYHQYSTKIKSVITHLAQAHFLSLVANAQQQKEEQSFSDLVDEESKRETLALLKARKIKNIGLIVVTSDRGLVGGYNSNVLKQTMELIKKLNVPKEKIQIIAIGRTGLQFLKKRGYNILYQYTGVKDVPKFIEIRPVVKQIVDMFNLEKFDKLYICYNHFVNMLTSEFRSEILLPITEDNLGVDEKSMASKDVADGPDYDTEPSKEEILNVVLPQYAESLIYGSVLDAKTAEHASSATAMKSATDNTKDIISTLQLQYNRARQAAITTEITEITGAQAAIE